MHLIRIYCNAFYEQIKEIRKELYDLHFISVLSHLIHQYFWTYWDRHLTFKSKTYIIIFSLSWNIKSCCFLWITVRFQSFIVLKTNFLNSLEIFLLHFHHKQNKDRWRNEQYVYKTCLKCLKILSLLATHKFIDCVSETTV